MCTYFLCTFFSPPFIIKSKPPLQAMEHLTLMAVVKVRQARLWPVAWGNKEKGSMQESITDKGEVFGNEGKISCKISGAVRNQ